MPPGPSGRPRLVVFAVSGPDVDPAALTRRLAGIVGPTASIACWSSEDETVPTANEPGPAALAAERLRLVVASRHARVFAAAHRQLSGSAGVAALVPVADPQGLNERLRVDPPQVLLLDDTLLDELQGAWSPAPRAGGGAMHVLLLCERVDARSAGRALGHGLHGCLDLDAPPGTWGRAIAAVRRGELWLSRAVLQRAAVAPQAASPAEPDPICGGLTPREAQTVALLRQGLSNKQIAQRLGVCEDTVKKHLHSVFAKLGVRRRTQVAAGIVGVMGTGPASPHAA